MSFGAPLGLLALLAIPVLVGLYFLRRRQPPRVVSALFLWSSPDQKAEAGPKLQRFSREASLALECAAALAATAFLADLHLGGKGAERHTVVVLDGSLSMSAKAPDGKPVADQALALVRSLAEEDAGRVTIIESGLRPRIVEGPAAERSRLGALVFQPRGPAHDFAPALSLARELAGPRARIRLITDKPLEPAPEGVEVHAIGAPRENDAFVAAVRTDRQSKTQVALRVAHFGAAPAELPVVLESEDGKIVASQRASLGPGEAQVLRFEVAATRALVAKLPDDALAADNRVRLLPQPVRPLTVRLTLPEGLAAESVRRFLAVDEAATATQAEPAEPADLVFAGTQSASAAPWTVVLGTQGEVRSIVGPFFADRRHPLLDSVPLEGLLWAAGEPVPGTPLLTAGEAILVSETPGPVVHLNVDLARSNLGRLAAWPVMLSNLFSMRRQALPGFARHDVALDEELSANVDASAKWTLQGPGTEQPLRGTGTLRLAAPGVPGIYRLLRDGKVQDTLEVLSIESTRVGSLAARERHCRVVAAGGPHLRRPTAQRHPPAAARALPLPGLAGERRREALVSTPPPSVAPRDEG
ncbi:MAG: VWA domain-containing protein [Myxococcales bacterium]